MSRILFLVSSMQGGGAERVAALLCNHWVAEGHRVTLMPTFSGRGECLYPLDERVRLDFLADRVGSRRRSMLNKLRRFKALRRAIREIQPEVIVSFLTDVNVAAVLAAWGLKVPVVVSERTYPRALPLRRALEALRRWVYPKATNVVVQTERGRSWLEKCCPRAQGQVIPNPVFYPLPAGEPRLEPSRIIPPPAKVTLAVGRLGEEKGFANLIQAFSELAGDRPDWHLVILGEGEERRRLEAQRDGLGLAKRVHLPGRAGNPGDWYALADVYVMSSRFEGFPNTLIEAMAHGVAVVSFDCATGPAEIIREGVDGYLVPPEQGAEGLSRGVAALMDDELTRKAMGHAATDVRERFSSERVMAAWDEVLGLHREHGNV
ncbi:glycosyltransferase family 4 protein [Spiribacter pallidus]|uniref:glycosyltransferase family 4 protein n=1 Tax=Spiribacter pallidus TaxID=1987936 RepID=UPI0034A016A6